MPSGNSNTHAFINSSMYMFQRENVMENRRRVLQTQVLSSSQQTLLNEHMWSESNHWVPPGRPTRHATDSCHKHPIVHFQRDTMLASERPCPCTAFHPFQLPSLKRCQLSVVMKHRLLTLNPANKEVSPINSIHSTLRACVLRIAIDNENTGRQSDYKVF